MKMREIALLMLALSVGFASCSLERDEEWRMEVLARPELESVLRVVPVQPPPIGNGTKVTLHGLVVSAPSGSICTIESKLPDPSRIEMGETSPIQFLHIVDEETKRRGCDVFVVPYESDEYDSLNVNKWCSNYASFRKLFSSDLDMMQQAHRAIPSDVTRELSDSGRNKMRALLMLKSDQVLPASEAQLSKATIFYGHAGTSGRILAETFDESGRWRCKLLIVPLGYLSSDGHPEDFIKSLYYSSFDPK